MKFSDIQDKRVIPVKGVTGLYIKDLPFARIQEHFAVLGEKLKTSPIEALWYSFDNLLRGEDGSRFEDINSEDDVVSSLSEGSLTDIVTGMVATFAFDDVEEASKNSEKAGTDK
jgi:hypothetical protein